MEHLKMQIASHRGTIVPLTGTTDYLGRAILSGLVEDNRVTEVRRVAVSKADEIGPANSTPDYAKVEAHVGSLSMLSLGLGEAKVELLSKEVDVIVHAATDKTIDSITKIIGLSYCKPSFGKETTKEQQKTNYNFIYSRGKDLSLIYKELVSARRVFRHPVTEVVWTITLLGLLFIDCAMETF
jgi:hypothetical protein